MTADLPAMLARRTVLLAASLAAVALASPPASHAQAAGARVRRIGVIGNASSAAEDPLHSLFVTRLRDLGWSESALTFEYFGGDQRPQQLADFARQLVAHGVDLIVISAGVTAALSAKQATATIPILAVGVADPVRFGLVESLSRPGGNVTGIAGPVLDWGKYLQFAREAVTGATRVAVIGNPTSVVYADYVARNEAAARELGLTLQMIPVARADELAPAFEAMKRQRADVLVFGPDRLYLHNLGEILDRAKAAKLPAISALRPAAEGGALASYGVDGRDLARLAATYADRILRGAKPADLPFEQPNRFELVINLKTAKALGLKISPSLLLRADEVIE